MPVLEHALELGIEVPLGGLHVRDEQAFQERRHLLDAWSELGYGRGADEVTGRGHEVDLVHESGVVLVRDAWKGGGHGRPPGIEVRAHLGRVVLDRRARRLPTLDVATNALCT
jgi:hypothetical protein